jgi:hypothetical protein
MKMRGREDGWITSAEVADGLRLLRVHGSGDLGFSGGGWCGAGERRGGGFVVASSRRRARTERERRENVTTTTWSDRRNPNRPYDVGLALARQG